MISVISTVLNEGESIRRLMDSLLAQTCPPDEVVIVDGGSRDETLAVLRSYEGRLPLRVLVERGANISAGRNRAIAAAHGDVIACTDAGTVLDAHWLEAITRPFAQLDVQVVAGFFVPEADTVFEAAMGATVLPALDEIVPATFLPSSRSVAFRKTAWRAVGGYPEWLDYCEDLIFDFRLRRLAPFAFAPDAVVLFRPRRSLRAFFRQYYHYARGDGKADLWRKRHAARYATYLVAAPLGLWLALFVSPLAWLALAAGAAVYLRVPYRRLPGVLRRLPRRPWAADWLYAAALIPVIRGVGDLAKMLGYPVGVIWRLRERPPDWRHT